MVEEKDSQPKLFETEDNQPNQPSNAEIASQIAAAAMARELPAWTDKPKSQAAIDQSGIPEDLTVNPIPPELAFMKEDEWHLAENTQLESLRQKPMGGIKRLAAEVTQTLVKAKRDYGIETEVNPGTSSAKDASRRLDFWQARYDKIHEDLYLSTILGRD